VYVLGGKDRSANALTSFMSFEYEAKEWAKLPNLPYSSEKPSVAELSGYIFFTAPRSKVIFVYDCQTQ
jgi:hypothetical protein